MPATIKTRVLVVDDWFDTAAFYNRLINEQPDLESAGIMGTAEGVTEAAAQLGVDVVLLDLVMPGPNPIESIRSIRTRVPNARVIAFSAHEESVVVMEVFDAGAWGFVSKWEDPEAVLCIIRRAVIE